MYRNLFTPLFPILFVIASGMMRKQVWRRVTLVWETWCFHYNFVFVGLKFQPRWHKCVTWSVFSVNNDNEISYSRRYSMMSTKMWKEQQKKQTGCVLHYGMLYWKVKLTWLKLKYLIHLNKLGLSAKNIMFLPRFGV